MSNYIFQFLLESGVSRSLNVKEIIKGSQNKKKNKKKKENKKIRKKTGERK